MLIRAGSFVTGLVFLGFLALAQPVRAGGLRVMDVRFWTAPDHTRVVIDCSHAPTFKDSRRSDPERVVVDIRDARLAERQSAIEVGDGLVRRVRLNTLRGGVVQVVLDLDSRQEYRVFTLPAAGALPHRIVIDVSRPESAAEQESHRRLLAELERSRTTVVMIDPGHGGEDPGALGPNGLKEKAVCLEFARVLREEINRRPGFKAFLTRDGDYYVSLRRRTELARRYHADYFVSVHTNASPNRKVHGTEVYFLSMRGASDESAKLVAQRENAADRSGGVPGESKDVIEGILMDLLQNSAMERSSRLADAVLARLGVETSLAIRGVKQAGFDVLKTAGVPSVLIEIGFITHRKESQLFANRTFRETFARAVAGGVETFARSEMGHASTPGD